MEITLSSSLSTIFVDILDATSDKTALSFHKETYDQASSWGENCEACKNGTIIIDGMTSYDLECIYDNPQNSSSTERKYVRLNNRFITIERNGKLYLIRFITEASQSDSIRDFQYLLDTWRWK
jgi:hypothetical protein